MVRVTLNFTLQLINNNNKKMIRKTSFLNQEFLCRTVKIFKALNKREERWSNVGKTAVIILQIFRERSGALVHLLGTTNA